MKAGAAAIFSVLLTAGAVWAAAVLPTFRGVAVAREDPEEIDLWGGGCSLYCAVIPEVRASSSLRPGVKSRYEAGLSHDYDLTTAWVEGGEGDGIGEYLEYSFDLGKMQNAGLALTNITVFNGYRKSRATWQENGRVKRFGVTVNGKAYGTIMLQDAYNYQTVKIGKVPLRSGKKTTVRLTIQEVYPGAKHRDTAITDLTFDGTGHH